MAGPDVFEFQDYKVYLEKWIASRPSSGHGERSRIARALNCQLAYISQVLGGKADFSLEQAEALNRYLGHDEEESEYLLLLVLRARASTSQLRDHFKRQVAKILSKRLSLRERKEFKNALPVEDQQIFYGSWYYAAIHLALEIPRLRTRDRIAEYLGLAPATVTKALEYLCRIGLARKEGELYVTGPIDFHLSGDTHVLLKQHLNWRLQAMQAIEREDPEALHYSSTMTLSAKAAPKVKAALIRAIEEVREITKHSPEEAVYSMSFDFFEVGKRR